MKIWYYLVFGLFEVVVEAGGGAGGGIIPGLKVEMGATVTTGGVIGFEPISNGKWIFYFLGFSFDFYLSFFVVAPCVFSSFFLDLEPDESELLFDELEDDLDFFSLFFFFDYFSLSLFFSLLLFFLFFFLSSLFFFFLSPITNIRDTNYYKLIKYER